MNRREFLKSSAASASLAVVMPQELFEDGTPEEKGAYIQTVISEFNDAAERQHIPLHDYLTEQKRIFATNPDNYADFVVKYTPFEEGATVSQVFNTVHGSINFPVDCETFLPFGNPAKSTWDPKKDVNLMETGGTIGLMHDGLGKFNNNDPKEIKQQAELAKKDISIQSKYTAPVLKHMETAHGVVLKVMKGGKLKDSDNFAAMKEKAKDHFILG